MLSWPPLATMRSRCGGYSFASRPRDLLPRYAIDHNKLGVPCVANQCLYARLGCVSVAGRRWWIDPTGERSWWGLRWGWSWPSCCRGAPSTDLTDILDRTPTLTNNRQRAGSASVQLNWLGERNRIACAALAGAEPSKSPGVGTDAVELQGFAFASPDV